MKIKKRELTGGAAIVEAARANGMTTIFGVPGAQIYPLFDALHGTDVDVIVPRHEQAAAYMAMGYAKSTGRTGVFTVVPGPGVLNASAALCTAMSNCAPVVCLTGQVPSSFLGRGRGHLHELADQAATLRTLIKNAWRIESASDASRLVNRAFRDAAGGRPGPVAVEMCWDTMAARSPVIIEPPEAALPEPSVDEEALDAAVRLLAAAKKPMIMCGAGAQHAPREVELLAETLQAPVTAFRSGRGVVPEDHALGVASVAARELWDDVDVLVGVGSRLEMPYMRWGDSMRYERRPTHGPKLIRIDIDPEEMRRFEPDVSLVADSATACRLLAERMRDRAAPSRARAAEIAAAKRVAAAAIDRLQPQAAFLRAIRAALPRDGILVPELSQVGFATYTGAFPVLAPRTYISEGFQGTLGFGFPTALGVKVANRDKPVVSVTGDGGFMFGVQELATAVQYGIALVTIVFNNRSFANVLRDQQLQFGGREIGSRLQNPDFLRLADSFGVAARRVEQPHELQRALEAELAAARPALIEVAIEAGVEQSPWPLIHMRKRPSEMLRSSR
ncbi:MAG TPA: thiamine pyrophosphate-dependent enzyme [Gammaproteobacteria bacterium]|nr:thiamine pyrophosphate-dependent enzyme [Gammaproteobacteria bacterium]